MKKLCVILLCATLLSCEKAKQKIAEDLVVQAMTSGQWKITSFVLNGNDITADFSTYKFQYHSNRTVDAIKNGVVENTGTWDGNATTMTTSASFPNPAYPLNLINGSWSINNSSWTHVVASQNYGGETKLMRLDKL